MFSFLSKILARQIQAAIRHKNLPRLKLLLDLGADPNARLPLDELSETGYAQHSHPIHEAIGQWWLEGLDLLLAYGADIELRGTGLNQTPLFYALDNSNWSTLELLARYEASLEGLGCQGVPRSMGCINIPVSALLQRTEKEKSTMKKFEDDLVSARKYEQITVKEWLNRPDPSFYLRRTIIGARRHQALCDIAR